MVIRTGQRSVVGPLVVNFLVIRLLLLSLLPFTGTVVLYCITQGDVVALLVGHWTCDLQVAGSSLG